MRRSLRAGLAGALLAMVVAGAATAADNAQAREAMRAIFAALTELFPLSLSETGFEDAERNARVEEALTGMLANVERLGEHGRGLPASYEFLRQTLANDVRQAADSYRRGHFEAARFLIHDLVNTCFGCHTRLPDGQRFDIGADLMGQPAVRALPLEERAMLATASRQFDQALELFEELMVAPDQTPSNIAYSGALENYLKLAVRVRGELDRARLSLLRFLERDDVPRYLRIHVESWVEALVELRNAERSADDLEAGRAVFREAQLRSLFAEDPRALVHFIEASRLLHRYVQTHSAADQPRDDADRERLGEAYYLLGVAESHITSNYWYSETEFFLESAIRLSPASAFARKAYAWLEEDVLLGYSGSAGVALPEDVSEYLEELRALIDGRTRTPQQ